MSEKKSVTVEVPESIRKQFPENKNFILVDAPKNIAQSPVTIVNRPGSVYQSQV